MHRACLFLPILALTAFGQDVTQAEKANGGDVIFRSDVALVRVDTQVVDRDNRAITGLTIQDFVLRERGKVRDIRNFASEDMPMDVLLLLDVSGSMQPHVERMASAAQQAFNALGREDRVAIMVFDRMTRMRAPFRSHRDGQVTASLGSVVRDENFNGGTDITRSIYSAIDYVHANARRDARKAIVILTDDMTEFERDENGIVRRLERDDIVLSLLLAPNMIRTGRGGGMPGSGGGQQRRTGGGWGGLGGVILGGGGWPGGGGGYPRGGGRGPVVLGSGGLKSAGTRDIAERSGGDSMSVDDASSLEDTLRRLRQRYALYFNLPEGTRSGEERELRIDLASAAQRRYPDSRLRYRGNYVAQQSNMSTPSEGGTSSAAGEQPSTSAPASNTGGWPTSTSSTPARRPRVSDPGSGANAGPMIDRDATPPTAADVKPAATAVPQDNSKKGGWPRVK